MAAKRILILNNRVPFPLNDGGNIAVNAMIDAYHSAGWQVYLLAMNTTRHYIKPEILTKTYTHIHRFETVDVDNNLQPGAVLKNLFFSSKPNHADRFCHVAFENRLKEILTSFQPDVVQVESIYLTEYLPLIKEKIRNLAILRLHNIEHQVWSRLANTTLNPLKRLYLYNLVSRLKKYEHRAWGQYDLLLPITDVDATYVSKIVNRVEVLTIPPGINFDELPPYREIEKWSGYHIGAMDWQPNASGIWWFLNKVWPSIHYEFPQFMFYFAGRNMPSRFRKLDYKNAICMGEVEDANRFLADKKILFVPIHSGGGIRIKILEAMAQGKLVISTDVGMQGINAWKDKHYLAANNVKEFITALRWAMMHRQDAEAICQNAAAMVRIDYDKEIVANLLLEKVNYMLDKWHV